MENYQKLRAWNKDTKQMIYDIYPTEYQDSLEFNLCTGKEDKDGVLMHKGDIVKNNLDDKLRFVDWSDEEAGFKMRELHLLMGPKQLKEKFPGYTGGDLVSDSFYPADPNWWKIIGNIHENPELLK